MDGRSPGAKGIDVAFVICGAFPRTGRRNTARSSHSMANGQSRKHAARQPSDEAGGHRVCRRLRISEFIRKGLPSRHGNVAWEIPLEKAGPINALNGRRDTNSRLISVPRMPRKSIALFKRSCSQMRWCESLRKSLALLGICNRTIDAQFERLSTAPSPASITCDELLSDIFRTDELRSCSGFAFQGNVCHP